MQTQTLMMAWLRPKQILVERSAGVLSPLMLGGAGVTVGACENSKRDNMEKDCLRMRRDAVKGMNVQ